jgi:hypothetical protein
LEENFKKKQYILDGVVKDLATTKTENEKLKGDIKQVRYQSRHVSGAQALLPVPASDDTFAMSHLYRRDVLADTSSHVQDNTSPTLYSHKKLILSRRI